MAEDCLEYCTDISTCLRQNVSSLTLHFRFLISANGNLFPVTVLYVKQRYTRPRTLEFLSTPGSVLAECATLFKKSDFFLLT